MSAASLAGLKAQDSLILNAPEQEGNSDKVFQERPLAMLGAPSEWNQSRVLQSGGQSATTKRAMGHC